MYLLCSEMPRRNEALEPAAGETNGLPDVTLGISATGLGSQPQGWPQALWVAEPF